ncbi:MAG: GNAT family N-acetyltransferase [Acidobacteriota bacterium]
MTTDVALRSALISEKEVLEALQWRASLNNPGDREALLRHADAIDIPLDQLAAGLVFVAECAGAIVGFAAIAARGDGDSELDALFVEPNLWRRGHGKALLLHCVEAARHRGSAALHVVGNPHAQAFYRACGFELLGTTQTRFGSGLLMRKEL